MHCIIIMHVYVCIHIVYILVLLWGQVVPIGWNMC